MLLHEPEGDVLARRYDKLFQVVRAHDGFVLFLRYFVILDASHVFFELLCLALFDKLSGPALALLQKYSAHQTTALHCGWETFHSACDG